MRLLILILGTSALRAFRPECGEVLEMSDGPALFILLSCIIQDWLEVRKS